MHDRERSVPTLAAGAVPEGTDPLAAGYYDSLLKWVRRADATFRPWRERANCGHFFGGSYWYGIDTAFTVAVYATLAKLGPYNEELTGSPRTRLLERAVAGIRYLGFTHDTGPADCVRVEGPNPECSGKKWGGAGQAFFPASQCGRPVSALGMAAWMLWGDLDEETRALVTAVVTTYAETWSAESPRSGAYLNTQTEENAWTGQGIYIAACMFPAHPRAEIWREAARTWLMNVRTVPDDSKDWALLDGKPVAQWVTTVTTHPDFSVENHGVVHPFYQGLGISFPAKVMLWNAMAGRPDVPDWLVRHMPAVYEAMKAVCLNDAQPLPVQGQDWWYEQHPEAAVAHCAMSVYLRDAEAACLEQVCLDYLKRVQDSNGDGRIYHSLSDRLNINATQTIEIKEVYAAYYVASCYLMHHFSGPGPLAVAMDEFRTRHAGVREFPSGGFVVHRRADSVASFAWRNSPMALTLPSDGMWVTVPQPYSYIGDVEVVGVPRQIPRLIAHRVERRSNGFAVVASMERGAGALSQSVVFASLPTGMTVYIDSLRAAADVQVVGTRRGIIGVRNELYGLLPGLADGRRVVYTDQGAVTAPMGFEDGDDTLTDLGNVAWVNLDNRMGFAVVGGHGARYLNRHRYPTWKGFEDTLYLDYSDTARHYSDGDPIASVAIVTAPNQAHADTRAMAASVSRVAGPDGLLGVLCGDYLVLGNTGVNAVAAEVTYPIRDEACVPVFAGCQRIAATSVTLAVELQALSATYLHSEMHLGLPDDPGRDVSVGVVGRHGFVSNASRRDVDIVVSRDGSSSEWAVPGQGAIAVM